MSTSACVSPMSGLTRSVASASGTDALAMSGGLPFAGFERAGLASDLLGAVGIVEILVPTQFTPVGLLVALLPIPDLQQVLGRQLSDYVLSRSGLGAHRQATYGVAIPDCSSAIADVLAIQPTLTLTAPSAATPMETASSSAAMETPTTAETSTAATAEASAAAETATAEGSATAKSADTASTNAVRVPNGRGDATTGGVPRMVSRAEVPRVADTAVTVTAVTISIAQVRSLI